MKRPKMLNERAGDFSNAVALIIFCLLIAVLSFELFFAENFFVVNVAGNSMLDTLSNGDYLYASRTEKPARGDVVVVDAAGYPPFADKEEPYLLIKRLIALGGDTVKCEDGVIFLKKKGETEFTALGEPYISAENNRIRGDFSAVTVGEGEIFVLGDNRDNSTDSRATGCFREEDVRGVVPAWSVAHKSIITAWEGFRFSLGGKLFRNR